MATKKKIKPAAGAPKRKDHAQAVMPAEIVLGPKALERIFINLLTGGEPTINPDQAAKLSNIFAFIDYKSQLVINTGAAFNGMITVRTEPISAAIGPELHAFTLVDIVGALTRAINEDVTGFILQLIAATGNRKISPAKAEALAGHFTGIINLLNS